MSALGRSEDSVTRELLLEILSLYGPKDLDHVGPLRSHNRRILKNDSKTDDTSSESSFSSPSPLCVSSAETDVPVHHGTPRQRMGQKCPVYYHKQKSPPLQWFGVKRVKKVPSDRSEW